jgi:protein-L-isoaspartate(D-aspartate) O-methyltransferase
MPEYHAGFEQSLAIGGRMFVIIGQAPVMEAALITRLNENDFSKVFLFETCIEALDGLLPPKRFQF